MSSEGVGDPHQYDIKITQTQVAKTQLDPILLDGPEASYAAS